MNFSFVELFWQTKIIFVKFCYGDSISDIYFYLKHILDVDRKQRNSEANLTFQSVDLFWLIKTPFEINLSMGKYFHQYFLTFCPKRWVVRIGETQHVHSDSDCSDIILLRRQPGQKPLWERTSSEAYAQEGSTIH